MKQRKSNLDEQQERRLLEIESRGCWLAFWGLLAALAAEILLSEDLRVFLGEWVLFAGLALYLAVSCIRAGIWDRRLDMRRKTCLLLSLIAGLCTALVVFGVSYRRFHKPVGSLCAGGIAGLGAFVLCCLAMLLAARATRKRQEKLNAEPEEEGEA